MFRIFRQRRRPRPPCAGSAFGGRASNFYYASFGPSTGSVMIKVVPLPTSLSTLISPLVFLDDVVSDTQAQAGPLPPSHQREGEKEFPDEYQVKLLFLIDSIYGFLKR